MILPLETSALPKVALQRRKTFAGLFVPTTAVSGEARRFVREALVLWGEDQLREEAEIIVAELASNAVLHARSPFRATVGFSAAGVANEPVRRLRKLSGSVTRAPARYGSRVRRRGQGGGVIN